MAGRVSCWNRIASSSASRRHRRSSRRIRPSSAKSSAIEVRPRRAVAAATARSMTLGVVIATRTPVGRDVGAVDRAAARRPRAAPAAARRGAVAPPRSDTRAKRSVSRSTSLPSSDESTSPRASAHDLVPSGSGIGDGGPAGAHGGLARRVDEEAGREVGEVVAGRAVDRPAARQLLVGLRGSSRPRSTHRARRRAAARGRRPGRAARRDGRPAARRRSPARTQPRTSRCASAKTAASSMRSPTRSLTSKKRR